MAHIVGLLEVKNAIDDIYLRNNTIGLFLIC
jgi:hypothetical protein